VSATIDIRREGDNWVIEGGSVRIQITKPAEGLVERFVEDWASGKKLAPGTDGSLDSEVPRKRRI